MYVQRFGSQKFKAVMMPEDVIVLGPNWCFVKIQ